MLRRFVILCCVLVPLSLVAQTYPDWDSIYVNDFADVLTSDEEAEIAALLASARSERGHEMTVVTIESLEAYGFSRSIERYADNLFDRWGVGDAVRNDGILMLVSVEDREVRIALGAGYPARYDGIAARIIQRDMVPAFRAGDMAGGILEATRRSLQDLRVDAGDDGEASSDFATRVPFFQQMQQVWEDWAGLRALVYAIGAVGAFFGGRAAWRRRPRKCPECGRVMDRLGDIQEDQYLDAGQRVEERIKSKNYDVFICRHDEHLTVEGHQLGFFSRYAACPKCQYATYETKRTTLRPATSSSMGLERLNHYCQNCSHSVVEEKSTPIISDDTTRSGFGGGGFSGGGGFGGGSSGGGGGSGSW